MKDEDDNAEATKVCNVMRMIGGMPRQSNFNGLHLQTRRSARIEPKGHFGAATNRTLASPEGKGVTKPPAQKGQPPEDSQ
jgi:hypothetical protein